MYCPRSIHRVIVASHAFALSGKNSDQMTQGWKWLKLPIATGLAYQLPKCWYQDEVRKKESIRHPGTYTVRSRFTVPLSDLFFLHKLQVEGERILRSTVSFFFMFTSKLLYHHNLASFFFHKKILAHSFSLCQHLLLTLLEE